MKNTLLAIALLTIGSTSLAGSACLDNSDPCAVFTWNGQEYCVERYEVEFVDGYIPSSDLSQVASSAMRKAWSNQASRCLYNEGFNGLFSNQDFAAKPLPDQLSFIEDSLNKMQVLAAKHPVLKERITPTRNYIANTLLPKYAAPIREYLKLLSQVDMSLEIFEGKISTVLSQSTSTLIKEETYKVLCSRNAKTRLAVLEERCNANGELCDLRLLFSLLQDCANTSSLATAFDKIKAISKANLDARNSIKNKRSDLEKAQQLILSMSATNEVQSLPDSNCGKLDVFGIGTLNFSPANEKGYGFDLRFLTGEWNFQELGVKTSATKGRYHVMRVADHARRCFLDPTYGRISYSAFEKSNSEDLATYTNRVFENLLVVGRNFAEYRSKLTPAYLSRFGITTDEDIRYMQANFDEARLKFQQLVLSQRGAGWLISLAGLYDSSINQYLRILEDSKAATLEYLNQGSVSVDYSVLLAILTDQTTKLLESYQIFFSDAERQDLELKLEKLKKLTSEDLSSDNASILQKLLLEIEESTKETFEESVVYQTISTKLTSLFGCPQMDKTYSIFEQLQEETLREKLFTQCAL